MVNRFCFLLFCFCSFFISNAQDLPTEINGYKFEILHMMSATDVKNQYKSSTCWVFSTHSFFESELIRMGKGPVDLSEMFIVRAAYIDRAENYLRRQSAAAFGQGAENHDVTNMIRKYGLVPQSVYTGYPAGEDKPHHAELEAVLKGIVEALHKVPDGGKLSPQWKKAYIGALDGYMGTPPEKFIANGKEYTPQSWAQSLGLNLDDYVAVSSYSHHPYYKPFILEVADNWSNGAFYNVPLDEFCAAAENAVSKGYSIAWATDVSEKSFSAKEGLALWPIKAWDDMSQGERDSTWKAPVKEKMVTAAERQAAFDELTTTDDHGMHITGMVQDQTSAKYFIVKNSWGTVKKEMQGYIYVSQPYFRAKTMSMMVHKDALPTDLKRKLGI